MIGRHHGPILVNSTSFLPPFYQSRRGVPRPTARPSGGWGRSRRRSGTSTGRHGGRSWRTERRTTGRGSARTWRTSSRSWLSCTCSATCTPRPGRWGRRRRRAGAVGGLAAPAGKVGSRRSWPTYRRGRGGWGCHHRGRTCPQPILGVRWRRRCATWATTRRAGTTRVIAGKVCRSPAAWWSRRWGSSTRASRAGKSMGTVRGERKRSCSCGQRCSTKMAVWSATSRNNPAHRIGGAQEGLRPMPGPPVISQSG